MRRRVIISTILAILSILIGFAAIGNTLFHLGYRLGKEYVIKEMEIYISPQEDGTESCVIQLDGEIYVHQWDSHFQQNWIDEEVQ